MQSGIDIADYLTRLEGWVSRGQPYEGALILARELASELKREISRKETLAMVNGKAPLLESDSLECQMWALSVLASAWSQWVFTAKSNTPRYRAERRKAASNAQIASLYVSKTITLAMEASAEIGSTAENNYRPEKVRKLIQVER